MPFDLMKSSDKFAFSNRWTRSFGFAAYRPRDSLERHSRRCMRMTCSPVNHTQHLVKIHTDPITQILYQIHHCQFPRFDLRIQPIYLISIDCSFMLLSLNPQSQFFNPTLHPWRQKTHHFVNVFCCTVIHCCCSANAILVRISSP